MANEIKIGDIVILKTDKNNPRKIKMIVDKLDGTRATCVLPSRIIEEYDVRCLIKIEWD